MNNEMKTVQMMLIMVKTFDENTLLMPCGRSPPSNWKKKKIENELINDSD